MAKYAGEAVKDVHPKVLNKINEDSYPSYSKPDSEFGGGMSASENRMVNHRGKIIYNTGAPKDTSGGKDLGRDSTNVITKTGPSPPEASCSATTQSRNRSGKGKSKAY